MSTIRLYDHPATDALGRGVDGLPQLALVGDFPHGKPSLSYEGRISIVNPAGNCTVRKLSGDLPLGAAVTVDNATHEVVVTWPAYQVIAAPILNAGFEAGDVGWQKGSGWKIAADNPPNGEYCANFLDTSGTSIIANTARSVCQPGTLINAHCNVRQGASSKHNAGACVRLEFFDVAGNPLPAANGNMIESGSNNEVQVSSVSVAAPANTAFARIAALAFRKRQNRKVYVDDFQWDLTQPTVGTDDVGSWCIVLEVTDELGRKAQWTGCIVVDSVFSKWVWVEETSTPGRTIRTADSYLGPWTTIALDAPGAPAAAGANGAWVSRLASLYIMYLFQGGQAIISTDTDLSDGTLTGDYKSLGSFQSFHERMVNGTHVLYTSGGPSVSPRVSIDGGATWTTIYPPSHSTADWGRYSPPHLMTNGKWVCYGEDNDFVPVGRRQVCVCSDLVPNASSAWARTNLSGIPANYGGSDVSGSNGTTYWAILYSSAGRKIYSYTNGAQSSQFLSSSTTNISTNMPGGFYLGDGIVGVMSGTTSAYLSYNNGSTWVSRSFGATVTAINRIGSLWVTCGDDAPPRVSTDNGVTWADIPGIAANGTQLEQGVFPIPAQLYEAGTGLWDG